MIIPNSLKKGDTIGIVSPASPLHKEDLENFNYNISTLKSKGYNIIYGKYLFANNGYLAGNDYQRAIDLMEMFINKNINAIICSRGGYGSERIIQYLDIEKIAKNPKIFVGFSNISILLNYFTNKLNMITYHGPMLKKKLNELNLKYLIEKLQNTEKPYKINILKTSNISLLNSSNLEWLKNNQIVGGNLCTITTSLATKYEINTNKKILFLEEINEPTYKIDRSLTQLKNSGKLNNCSGFIIGDFTNCNSNNIPIKKVLLNTLISLKKPILMGFPSGHDENNITIPIGGTLLQNQ